eukprot:Anaeramoba_ignava/a485808_10.p1 GENE.a485808_10~~a485808_10.p1  ORF type:complete len:109 (+),score=50.45 a485808_10:99-425(+)
MIYDPNLLMWLNTNANPADNIDWGDSSDSESPHGNDELYDGKENVPQELILDQNQKEKMIECEKKHNENLKGWKSENYKNQDQFKKSGIREMAILYLLHSTQIAFKFN